jgi:DNA-binding Xre family transcriptional regulator
MISYEPLHKTLEEKGLKISSLRYNPVHPDTIATINKGGYITLQKIEELCITLNVPIEKVVEIKLNK